MVTLRTEPAGNASTIAFIAPVSRHSRTRPGADIVPGISTLTTPGHTLGHMSVIAESKGEALLVVLYAYVGFEGTMVAAGEGRRPRRDVPRAIRSVIGHRGGLR